MLLKGVRPLNLVSVSSVLLISCVKEVMNLGASDQDLNKRTLVTFWGLSLGFTKETRTLRKQRECQ